MCVPVSAVDICSAELWCLRVAVGCNTDRTNCTVRLVCWASELWHRVVLSAGTQGLPQRWYQIIRRHNPEDYNTNPSRNVVKSHISLEDVLQQTFQVFYICLFIYNDPR